MHTKGAAIMLVGEQPGDQEDVQGRPFVGPAGKLLDRALVEAGIDRSKTYVTNAVKHFKWTPSPRGKRRLHSRPLAGEMRACRPWLDREIELVNPRVLVTLGATAGQSLVGASFRVGAMRGKVRSISLDDGRDLQIVATIHPSAILRAPDDEARKRAYAAFVRDLRAAARAARED
jgi:DNA polymerase